jgi:hypothetical protein
MYGWLLDGDGAAIHMITMLAVRCIGEQHPHNQIGISSEGRPAGRIIGPAVSVISGSMVGYKPDQYIDVKWDSSLDIERRCSIRLV